MGSQDVEALVSMGFDLSKAEAAVKATGSLADAVDWITAHGEESEHQDAILKPTSPSASQVGNASQDGQVAQSLVCDDCGHAFRGAGEAELHAHKTGHENFSESQVAIAPLTDAEKKAKLESLRQKLAEKKAGTSVQDDLDKKRNEEIRRKGTKESQDIKEDLMRKEQLKQAAARKREKQDEILAKQKVRERIAQDREEKRNRFSSTKGSTQSHSTPSTTSSEPREAPHPSAPLKIQDYAETRLRLQTSAQTITKAFPSSSILAEVAQYVESEIPGISVATLTQNYPKKVYSASEFTKTLAALGLAPSAVLIVA